MNPEVRDALRNFAVLDGAFVIREDGVVLAAGRYLTFDEHEPLKVPLGLGARHMAAAGITRETETLAIVVSQTTGGVRVFRRGEIVLDFAPSERRVGGTAWRRFDGAMSVDHSCLTRWLRARQRTAVAPSAAGTSAS